MIVWKRQTLVVRLRRSFFDVFSLLLSLAQHLTDITREQAQYPKQFCLRLSRVRIKQANIASLEISPSMFRTRFPGSGAA